VKTNDIHLENILDEIDLSKEIPIEEPLRQYYFIKKCQLMLKEREAILGRPLTACITTFGCQMNARDSEKLQGVLEVVGYEITTDEHADFVMYNTCTIRENANSRVYGRLGALNSIKKKNPEMMIALCGCMMQEEHVVEKLKHSYRFINLIFGTHNIYKFAELLASSLEEKHMVIDIWEETDKIVEDLPIERKYPFKSGVNIMFGCNNFCSYCIVPSVRGRERSRVPEEIIKEITSLVADGVVEIMLLGQNVNSYGKNLDYPMTFAQLLNEIEKIDGLKRIRFMTSHPKDLSDELIEVMKNSTKVCKHLHLPLQAGSSAVLKTMNRHYDKAHYLKLVTKLRKAIPDISLTTDIIVGFPSETEADFVETVEVVREVRYDSAFTFIYSKRTGTPAAEMECCSTEEEIKARFNRLLREVQSISREQCTRFEGQIQEVLVEEVNEQHPELFTGRLESNITVHFQGSEEIIGKLVKVKLLESKGFYYMGELAEI